MPDPVRIMQIMAGSGEGGAETFYVDLVTALQRRGVEQIAMVRRNTERPVRLRASGVPVRELRFGGALDVLTRLSLAREVRRFQPDIVQTWMNRATTACPRSGGRFVHVGWLGGYYTPSRFRHCDHVVGVTEDIVAHMRAAGWPPARSHYIPTFAVRKPAEPLNRAGQETPEDAPLLLFLGRLHRKKALDVLLEALVSVPDAWLWIAGEGPLRGEMERLAATLGVAERVRFLGWRTDREALLATADLCVFPSRYEPFGTVTIEAWAASTPLVAAASAGPAAVIRDGEDALLVPVDDVEALATAIRRVLGDPALAQRLAAGGLRRYEESFTEEACARQYLAFYESILADRAARP